MPAARAAKGCKVKVSSNILSPRRGARPRPRVTSSKAVSRPSTLAASLRPTWNAKRLRPFGRARRRTVVIVAMCRMKGHLGPASRSCQQWQRGSRITLGTHVPKSTCIRQMQHHSQTAPTAFVLPSRTSLEYLPLSLPQREKTATAGRSRHNSPVGSTCGLTCLNGPTLRCFPSRNNRSRSCSNSPFVFKETRCRRLRLTRNLLPFSQPKAALTTAEVFATFMPCSWLSCCEFCINFSKIA